LLGVRTFDSDVSGKLEVGREIDMVLVETHAGKFFCKLLEFIRDKKRFQRYDPAFISGMNRINTTIKKTDARKEKQIGGSANSASGAQAKTPPLHDLSGKMKLLKFYTITFH